jgi:hypothetical protein
MTIEQFRAYLRAQPFVPFAIHLGDGRQIEVHHPENALLNEAGRTAAAVNADNAIETIDLLLVTSLRPLNGRVRGRRRRRSR